jgi:hypothetical protein
LNGQNARILEVKPKSSIEMAASQLRVPDVGFTRIGIELSLFHIMIFPANSMARNGGASMAASSGTIDSYGVNRETLSW